MKLIITIFLLSGVLVAGLRYAPPRTYHQQPGGEDPGDPLILTTYIKNDKIDQAHSLSEVKDVGDHKSYSGYFTVDDKHGSNMFFWLFPAQKASASAPLLLWLQGGPGGPSMFGLFVETGPLMVDKEGNVHQRNITWNEHYHLLYIDNPVGTGFSFTNSSMGLSTNEDQVADNLYSALIQFFTVFSEYQKSEFFITGESYAGKYIPAIGNKIHTANHAAKLKINLAGFALGDALIDPEHIIPGYGDLLYQTGMADKSQAQHIDDVTNAIVKQIQEGNYKEAFIGFDVLLNGDIYTKLTYFYNITGITDYFNYLRTNGPDEFNYFPAFLNKDSTRQAIHVGKTPFHSGSTDVERALLDDIMASMATNFTVCLENYKVLLYNGQLDLIVGAPLTENFMRQLKWSKQDDYLEAKRKIWKLSEDDTEVVGYYREIGSTFQQVVVRNAGHILPYDQPLRAKAMIENFIGLS